MTEVYRPILLVGSLYKTVAKIYPKLRKILNKIIDIRRLTLAEKRGVLNSVVANESNDEIKRKKLNVQFFFLFFCFLSNKEFINEDNEVIPTYLKKIYYTIKISCQCNKGNKKNQFKRLPKIKDFKYNTLPATLFPQASEKKNANPVPFEQHNNHNNS